MNMVTHIVGGAMGLGALVLCVIQAARFGTWVSILSAVIFGVSLVLLYTISSVYHGLRPGTAKKVMQVLDHCTIYILIAGTYTPIVLGALRQLYPGIGWGLFAFEWSLAILAIVLNAIDLKKFKVFSMICYIGLGWTIFPFLGQIIEILGMNAFLLLLFGGISYTVGAILYGIGSKVHWMHSVFHIFVVIGSLLHIFCIYFYVL